MSVTDGSSEAVRTTARSREERGWGAGRTCATAGGVWRPRRPGAAAAEIREAASRPGGLPEAQAATGSRFLASLFWAFECRAMNLSRPSAPEPVKTRRNMAQQ